MDIFYFGSSAVPVSRTQAVKLHQMSYMFQMVLKLAYGTSFTKVLFLFLNIFLTILFSTIRLTSCYLPTMTLKYFQLLNHRVTFSKLTVANLVYLFVANWHLLFENHQNRQSQNIYKCSVINFLRLNNIILHN